MKAERRLRKLESEIGKAKDIVVIHGETHEEIEEQYQALLEQGREPKTLIRVCAPGLKTC